MKVTKLTSNGFEDTGCSTLVCDDFALLSVGWNGDTDRLLLEALLL